MAERSRKPRASARRLELLIPLTVLVSFALGAGSTWLVMHRSANDAPVIQSFLPPIKPQPGTSPLASAESDQPPDVSQLTPADAARALANWNYDRQKWSQAIEHYEQAIALGADNPDVRTDLGNCFRFLGQAQKALEQYQTAQKQNPQHENSLLNQIGLFAEVLHDDERAASTARDFLTRFPQSPQAGRAKQLLLRSEKPSGSESLPK